MDNNKMTQNLTQKASESAQPKKIMSLKKKVGLSLAGLATAVSLTFGGIYASVINDKNKYTKIYNTPVCERTLDQEAYMQRQGMWANRDGTDSLDRLIRKHPELKGKTLNEIQDADTFSEITSYLESKYKIQEF